MIVLKETEGNDINIDESHKMEGTTHLEKQNSASTVNEITETEAIVKLSARKWHKTIEAIYVKE